MSFQFRFEKIVTMKEKEKQSALHEMNVFKVMKDAVEEQLLELVAKKESYMNAYEKSMQNSLRITEIQEREQYLSFLNKQIEKVKKKVVDITKEFNLKSNLLLAKNQEEKIWNSWRDKSLEEYTEKVKKDEQYLLDEMAVIRHFHNKI